MCETGNIVAGGNAGENQTLSHRIISIYLSKIVNPGIVNH